MLTVVEQTSQVLAVYYVIFDLLEPGRTYLNQCDSFTEISKIIENRANFQETEIDDVTKEMSDFVVILTSGGMFDPFVF